MIERVKTGIPGLDKIIEGGLIPGSTTLVSGSTGTGKTIFCGQFLWYGLQNNEPGIYITCEESPEEIKNDLLKFGWNFEKYEKKKKFMILFIDPFGMGKFTVFEESDFASAFIKNINKIKAKRLVLDSVSILGMYFKDIHETRRKLYMLVQALKKSGVTSLLTSEIPEGSNKLSRFGVEEFVVDNIILLHYLEYGVGGGMDRSLIVRKMRRTNHGTDIYPLKIGKDGISIKSVEK